MNERVKSFLEFYKKREFRKTRKTINYETIKPSDEFSYYADAFALLTSEEVPTIYEGDIFGFNRTVKNTVFLGGDNFTPEYSFALNHGLNGMIDEIMRLKEKNPKSEKFYLGAASALKSLTKIAEKYLREAQKQGNKRLIDGLSSILSGAPKDYYEALLTLKAVIFALRGSGASHVTIGRFDKYMYPFYEKSIQKGATRGDILELTELFFISLNLDTDIYAGVQQGDNGQSLVLGGRTENSEDNFNELSEIVLDASEELCVIDPKINIRVNSKTPLERFIRGTRLTAKGLGFPQYSNDDIVIDGLVALGYDRADAENYSIAACWEFIIPDVAYDIVNIATLNFPKAIREATVCDLVNCKNFDEFLNTAKMRIKEQFLSHTAKRPPLDFSKGEKSGTPTPLSSIFIRPCREKGIDRVYGGAKYNNFGIHGLGIAPAVDALAAIKTRVFEEKSITAEELLAALEADFEGHREIRNLLLTSPKYGNNDDITNEIAVDILDFFSRTVNGTPNGRGGIWRAGTGGPQDYVYMARGVGATADGRLKDSPFPSSFSPSIGVKANGLLSVIDSFTKPDLRKTINGGPLTVEIHENVFAHPDGIPKVAALVQTFIKKRGHQLQINAISRDKLLDAQKHPENYPDLIVRVWGWSGYFNELDLCFQNQIISRTEYGE
ncbi:MAG: pyruvate formate-lyase [Clostridia bacterium]|nr:pyruvate formate-lyase [Clostridia bacterium]